MVGLTINSYICTQVKDSKSNQRCQFTNCTVIASCYRRDCCSAISHYLSHRNKARDFRHIMEKTAILFSSLKLSEFAGDQFQKV